MEEDRPSSVRQGINSLGLTWIGEQYGALNFGNNAVLKSWWKDLQILARRLQRQYRPVATNRKDVAARKRLRTLLHQYGEDIWGENATIDLKLTVGTSSLYQYPLVYPRDTERLLCKHLELLHRKWNYKMHPISQRSKDDIADYSCARSTHSSAARRSYQQPHVTGVALRNQELSESEPLECIAVKLLTPSQPSSRSSSLEASQPTKYPHGCPCRVVSSNAISTHKQVYHFSCSTCGEVYAQTELQNHPVIDHDEWNLLPLDTREAEMIYENVYHRSFPAQGYQLATEYASKLGDGEASAVLEVRKQVDKSVLIVNVEGTQHDYRVHLEDCHNVEDLFSCICKKSNVDIQEIELLLIKLPPNWSSDVELQDCYPVEVNDNGAFTEFIGMIEKTPRKAEGEARSLAFLCSLLLWQD